MLCDVFATLKRYTLTGAATVVNNNSRYQLTANLVLVTPKCVVSSF